MKRRRRAKWMSSPVNNTVARTGSLLAVAVLPAVAGITGDSYLHPAVFESGFQRAAIIAAVICAAGGLLAGATIRNPSRSPAAPKPHAALNDAVLPSMIVKNVPNVFPTTCARSMYEPFNRLKFGQFASYYDQMRAGVKHFAVTKGVKTVGVMYQDTDYGRDVLAGAQAQVEAMGLKLGGTTGHKPTDTDFNGAVAKLRDANCDLIVLGTIMKDTVIILQTAHKQGWNPIFMGNFATYSTAVAEAPGGPAEGFFSMSPAPYRYPDDLRPAVHAFATKFKQTYGIDVNYLGEAGYTAASFSLAALEKAGRDLTADSFIAAMESMKDWRDIFEGPPLSMTSTNHHASNHHVILTKHRPPTEAAARSRSS